jgi:hypothetical protein
LHAGIGFRALRVERLRGEGHSHRNGDLLGGKVGLGRPVPGKQRVLEQPRARTYDAKPLVVAVHLLYACQVGASRHVTTKTEQVRAGLGLVGGRRE